MLPINSTCPGGASQRGRRQFSEDSAVCHGEAPELGELATTSNLRDAHGFRICTTQCCTCHVHPTQQDITGRIHTQKFIAAYPKGTLPHPYGRAKPWYRELEVGIGSQSILEARHDIGTTPPRYPLVTHILDPQAISERIEQFVLQGRGLWLRE